MLRTIALAAVTLVASVSFSLPCGARTRNLDLRSQVGADPARNLPRSEAWTFAVDGHLFYRAANEFPGYYHGGYWIDGFMELTPNDKLAVNGRLVLVNPSASYGTNSSSLVHPFVGISWNDNLKNYIPLDIEVRGRFFDLDRQTLGAGLTLDEKEMSGLILELRHKDVRFKHLANGTGGYDLTGDLNYESLDLWNDTVGLATMVTHVSGPRMISLYSSRALGAGMYYGIEASRWNRSWAGMARLGQRQDWNQWLSSRLQLQWRRYGPTYSSFHPFIEHDYLSIEQEDKDLTDSMNIFGKSGGVTAHSANVDLTTRLTHWLSLFSLNEYAVFDYDSHSRDTHYLYRHGISVCPKRNGNDCASVFLSNKMSSAEYPINTNDRIPKHSFLERRYWGMEARFRF